MILSHVSKRYRTQERWPKEKLFIHVVVSKSFHKSYKIDRSLEWKLIHVWDKPSVLPQRFSGYIPSFEEPRKKLVLTITHENEYIFLIFLKERLLTNSESFKCHFCPEEENNINKENKLSSPWVSDDV